MSCFYCKGELEKSTTVFSAQIGEQVVVVKNVPCLACVQCGETVFTDKVMKQLTTIVEQAAGQVSEVSVIDYMAAA